MPSRTRDGRTVRVGNADHSVFAGPNHVWQSYGVPWANLSDTPLRLYKHYTHEGGIATPFIASWPGHIRHIGILTRPIAHITDVLPTLVDIAGAKHPDTYQGNRLLPLEGRSLRPLLETSNSLSSRPIFWEHEGNRAVRLGAWKLVARHGTEWELYNIETDRTESHNLAKKHPERVKDMASLYEAWAERCHVVPPEQLPKERPIPAATSPD